MLRLGWMGVEICAVGEFCFQKLKCVWMLSERLIPVWETDLSNRMRERESWSGQSDSSWTTETGMTLCWAPPWPCRPVGGHIGPLDRQQRRQRRDDRDLRHMHATPETTATITMGRQWEGRAHWTNPGKALNKQTQTDKCLKHHRKLVHWPLTLWRAF